MAFRQIIGRAGSGKTQYCLNAIVKELKRNPLGPPLILLVPEQATFQLEKALASASFGSGFMRAQVLSFNRLAYWVMQRVGGAAVVPILDSGKAMILHQVFKECQEKFLIFQHDKQKRGLIDLLNQFLSQLKRYDLIIDPKIVPEGHGLLVQKLHDIHLIDSEMHRRLSGRFQDGEDTLVCLARGLAQVKELRGCQIWLDGFTSFTPLELKVIAQLLRIAENVEMTLCLDRFFGEEQLPAELHLFHATAKTSTTLSKLAKEIEVEEKQIRLLNPEKNTELAHRKVLNFLEKNFENHHQMSLEEIENKEIFLHAAVNRHAEVEHVARDMRMRAREQGLHWHDMTVLVRDVALYQDLLSNIFANYKIPYYFDGKKNVTYHPLVEFVRSALKYIQDWSSEAFFRCAKTDLLCPWEGNVTRDEVDLLENYVLAMGIDHWRWLYDPAWLSPFVHKLEMEEETTQEAEEQLTVIRQIRDTLLAPLCTLAKRMNAASSVRKCCEAVYLFLEETHVADHLQTWALEDQEAGNLTQSRVHRPLWDAVLHLLDQMVELLGETILNIEMFAEMIEVGLENLELAILPPSLDCVLIGDPEHTKTKSVKMLYLIGLNDTALPKFSPQGGLLTEEEQQILETRGFQFAPSSRRRLLDERFLAYELFTAPSHHLWISYPMVNTEGKTLFPSEWISKLQKKFPSLPLNVLHSTPGSEQNVQEQLAFISDPGQVLTHLLIQLRKATKREPLSSIWLAVYDWFTEQPSWNEKLQSLLPSLTYPRQEVPLGQETSLLLYGERLRASVSCLERFAACPFQHFATYGLRLKERQKYRLNPPDIGQLFHATLRETTEKMQGKSSSIEQWQQQANEALDVLMPRLQSRIFLSSFRHQAIARKLRAIMQQTSAALGRQDQVSKFHPIGIELTFGSFGQLPALTLPLNHNRFLDLEGKIDRVDMAQSSAGLLLRVIDYKSRSMQLNLEEVTQGLSLQLLTYIDVVITHSEQWLGQQAKPAGILYFHMQNPFLLTSNGMTQSEAQEALFRKYKMQGLVLADPETVQLMDQSLLHETKSTVIPVGFKKNGQFSQRSQVATEQEWEGLRSCIRTQIKQLGDRIIAGEVAVAPMRLKHKNPCSFCSFNEVCHVEAQEIANRNQETANLTTRASRENFWEKIVEEAKEEKRNRDADYPTEQKN